MELRSRSRSKTPLQSENFIEGERFVGNSQVIVTRSSRRTTVRTAVEGSSASSEHFYSNSSQKPSMKSKSSRSSKSLGSVIKTSDYSSEDGEFDTIKHITQNEKNRIIEDAKAAANGSAEVSALSLYRRARRYWDEYPKTDYTYSPHSRDRVEIAPGVVQMPNMSRPTIHSYDSSTNTDYYDQYTSRSLRQKLSSSSQTNAQDESFKIIRASSSSQHTVISSITTFFVTIYTSIFWLFYSVYKVQNSTVIWFFKQLHHFSSRIMLIDTWLLRKSSYGRKTRSVMALCLLPLLIFAGLHVLLASGVSLVPSCHPHCGRIVSTYYNSFINSASNVFK